MLITKIKAGKFGPATIKDIPTYIATKFYFRYAKELNKKELHSLIETLTLVIIKIKK